MERPLIQLFAPILSLVTVVYPANFYNYRMDTRAGIIPRFALISSEEKSFSHYFPSVLVSTRVFLSLSLSFYIYIFIYIYVQRSNLFCSFFPWRLCSPHCSNLFRNIIKWINIPTFLWSTNPCSNTKEILFLQFLFLGIFKKLFECV